MYALAGRKLQSSMISGSVGWLGWIPSLSAAVFIQNYVSRRHGEIITFLLCSFCTKTYHRSDSHWQTVPLAPRTSLGT